MNAGQIFAHLTASADGEISDEILRRGPLRIERIVSRGEASPPGFWYDQDEDEWVLVLRGRAGLEIEGREGVHEMGPGDYVDLPAHCRHRVAWTAEGEPTVWLAVFNK
jgi:cupin 2 domain-containing protein